jgi:hypothetical protein
MTFALVAVLAGVAWFERTPLLSWYYVRGLANADEAACETWVNRVTSLGNAALPRLIDQLRQVEVRPCENAAVGMMRLVESWDQAATARGDLAGQLVRNFASFSPHGQAAALQIQSKLVQTAKRGTLVNSTTLLVTEAAQHSDHETQTRALELAAELFQQTRKNDAVDACRLLLRACAHSEEKKIRLQAIQVAARSGGELLEGVVALLRDPDAEVRRAALLAVGSSPVTISSDDLLPLLHDGDEVVKRLCEEALRGRGLREQDLRLGRLMTDPRPTARLQVLDLLRQAQDLEPSAFLRRLTHDDSPAVRAAAVRMASEQATASLQDRLEQMIEKDPSPTVRQLAQYYLNRQKAQNMRQPFTR